MVKKIDWGKLIKFIYIHKNFKKDVIICPILLTSKQPTTHFSYYGNCHNFFLLI